MSEDVWVLGASMTKIGRYPDKDVIDLASEAAMNALSDGGVTIQDMQGVQRPQRVRDRCHRGTHHLHVDQGR
jgi:hypothetical protein